MDLTPKQQASEAIRQAESILIVTGQRPNVDQVTAVLALSVVLRKLGKKVSAIVSDQLPAGIDFLPTKALDKSMDGLRDFILKVDLAKAEVDKLKYTIEEGKLNIHVTPFKGKFTPGDVTYAYGDFHYDLAVVIGVPSRSRIDKVLVDNDGFFEKVPVVNIDFHRTNEQFGAINLVETNAASLSEIIVAMAESLQNGIIDAEIGTVLLTGIMASTDRFTATHTSPKALTVAAQLMAAGADQQLVVKSLFKKGERPVERHDRSDKPAPKRAEVNPSDVKEAIKSAQQAAQVAEPQAQAQSQPKQPQAEAAEELPVSPLESLRAAGKDIAVEDPSSPKALSTAAQS
jgi:hypothetical protein